jgi:hypothetical protein
MLPAIVPASAIPTVDILPIGIIYVSIVSIYVYVVIPAPSAAVTPSATPRCSYGKSDAK